MEAKQLSLFDTPQPIAPRDPHASPTDIPRLSGQNALILDMLRARPRTNDELAAVSRKYTSRISDLRAAGHVITARRVAGGLFEYTLNP
jgi:hypothetical protein